MNLTGVLLLGVLPGDSTMLLGYLDPGTGSIVLQAVLAVILGGMWVFKSSLRRVRDGIASVFQRGDRNEQSNN
jgi:hypothetical protein